MRNRGWQVPQLTGLTKGVLACCLFNQFMSNNPSAPERWLEPGEIIPVMQME